MIGRLLVLALRGWQRFISPLYGPRCKYHPSCSAYAITAISRHGPVRGTALAGWRVLRCNPFSDGGYDPVPERRFDPAGHPGRTSSGTSSPPPPTMSSTERPRRSSSGAPSLPGPVMSDDGGDDPHPGGPTDRDCFGTAGGPPPAVRAQSPPRRLIQPEPMTPNAVPVTAAAGEAHP